MCVCMCLRIQCLLYNINSVSWKSAKKIHYLQKNTFTFEKQTTVRGNTNTTRVWQLIIFYRASSVRPFDARFQYTNNVILDVHNNKSDQSAADHAEDVLPRLFRISIRKEAATIEIRLSQYCCWVAWTSQTPLHGARQCSTDSTVGLG